MTIQGVVENGVVVLPAGAQLPEGAIVKSQCRHRTLPRRAIE